MPNIRSRKGDSRFKVSLAMLPLLFWRFCANSGWQTDRLDKGRTPCYIYSMNEAISVRAFKTEWFAKAAQKAGLSDVDLCNAIEQVRRGQCDDLGGGVFKKRLNENRHRSIVIAKGGKYWVYSFLFAKKDRENITKKELEDFREIANTYAKITEKEIELALENEILLEICHGKKV
jgi:hypothetical protein